MSNVFDQFDAKAPAAAPASNPFDQFDPAPAQDGPLVRGFKKSKQALGLTASMVTGDAAGTAQKVAEADAYAKANPGTKEGAELMDAWNKGDGVTGGVKAVVGEIAKDWNDSPNVVGGFRSLAKNAAAMGSGIVEQVPNMIAPVAGLVAGGLAGGAAGSAFPVVGNAAGAAVGGFVGASAGNAAIEGGGMLQEELQKAGINPQDRAAVQDFVAKNGDRILGQAGVKGAVIGAVDTATAGLGHWLLTGPGKAAATRALSSMGVDLADKAAVKAASESTEFAAKISNDAAYKASTTGARGFARNAGAAALDPAGEFAGEFVGQGAATGEWDTKNAALEALSSVGQSAAMFAGQKGIQYATQPRGFKPGTPLDEIAAGGGESAPAAAAPETQPGGLSLVPMDAQPGAAPAGDQLEPYPGGLSSVQTTFDPRDPASTPPMSIMPMADENGIPFVPTGFTPRRPSEAMGLDASAGTLSAAAVTAVDSGASPVAPPPQAAAPTEKPTRAPAQAPTLTGAAGAATGFRPGAAPAAAAAPAPATAGPDLSAWSVDQLRAQRWGSQDKGVRNAMAQELARRRAAAADAPPTGAPNAQAPQATQQDPAPSGGATAPAQDPQAAPAVQAAGAAKPGAGVPAAGSAGVEANGLKDDGEWRAFPPDSGTLNIPRADMPQVKAEHRGPMVNFLKARGIDSEQLEVPAESLKPTQAEYSVKKVASSAGLAATGRSVLVSSDGHVLDGHHQWMAAREAGEPVKVIRLNAPIKELLTAVREFPSSTTSPGATAPASQPVSAPAPTPAAPAPAPAAAPASLPQAMAQAAAKKDPAALKAKALERIARGTAFFSKESKAREYLKSHGLSDTHTIERHPSGANRWDVVAKAEEAPQTPTQENNLGTQAPETQQAEAQRPQEAKEQPASDLSADQKDAIKKHGLPLDTIFSPGKGTLGTGKWVATSGSRSGNLVASIDEAAQSLANFLASDKQQKESSEQRQALAADVAGKLKRGEQPTDAQLRDLFGLSTKHSYVDQAAVGQFLVDFMGVPRNSIRKALGLAAGDRISDGGARYPIVYPRKLHQVFGPKPTIAPTTTQPQDRPNGPQADQAQQAEAQRPQEPEAEPAREPWQDLRALSTKERPADGGVKLTNDRFVTLDQAISAAKQHMTPDEWTRPFQWNRVLDIAPIDWDRMVKAMKADADGSANADQAPTPAQPPAPAAAPAQAPAPAPAPAGIFGDNKLFTADKVAAARERMRKKLGTMNSGIDPELLVDGMTIAGAYIEAGVRKFGDFAKAMVDDMGEGVKPYLLSFWEGARNYPGLETEGMTTPADAAAEYKAMMTPEVVKQAPEALGEEVAPPAKRVRKTGVTSDMTLTQDWGVEHIDGYGDADREEGSATKDAFLKEARQYLGAVEKELAAAGFEPHADRKGKPGKAVSVNESGPAGSGEVSLTMRHPELGTNIYVHVGDTALRGMFPSTPSGIAVMARTSTAAGDTLATKGQNRWMPVDLSAADLAALVLQGARGTMEAQARANKVKESENGTPEQAGSGADQSRAPELSGGRADAAQPGAAPADSGSVAPEQPQDVPAPADAGGTGSSGVRVAAEDVGRAGPADKGGDAGNGRARAGGTRAPAAGARGTARVKAPEEVSPANPGPGNFHIDNPLEIVGGGQVARFDKNQAAIDLLNRIREESRQATAEEQKTLAGYTGWGSFGQELFQGTWEKPMPKPGWEARDRWLRDHLGEDEWKSAQRSITNAHYTDPPTVMAMWDMVKRMGFTGGRVLEPSMGIGNFFGMMPLDLKSRSQLAGIELDRLTGTMAKMLYPNANVKIMGYQESKTPDNFYDVVIGNWPFENTVIADRRYNTLSPFLHDYFFLKALDQVRPGGVVVGITSNGTMDKKATKIRAALARKAELVTSIRLPSGAFQEYAGTKVVTDIVILKKREQPLSITPNEPWINSVSYKTPAGPEVFINEFYVKNPGNVIGTTDFGHGTTRMQPGMIVHRPDNMAQRLREAVNLVPQGVLTPVDRTKHISYVTNHTADREGSLTEQDGKLFVVRGEHLAPAHEVLKYQVKSEATTAKREEQLRGLIGMRRQYAALIEAERAGDAKTERSALRASFEAFEAAHGALGNSFGLDYLRRIDDPFYPALAALTVNGQPAAILRESTIRGARSIENPSPADAYVLARNRSVQPTLGEIAAIAGKSEDEVRKALLQSGAVFEAPNGDVIPSDIYLSGNVRQKLREARAALEEGNKAMERNVAELAAVVPADVPYFNIESQLGATWVPAKAYADYVAHMLNRTSSDGIEANFINGRWKVRLPDGANNAPEAQTGFGTREYPFSKLVNAAFTNQTVKIRRKDGEGNEFVDTAATDEANARISEIRGRFAEWLWSDPERRAALEQEYNEARNAYATPKYDGSFLAFDGMALSLGRGPFNLRQHQVNAIWRALVNRRSLNAHEVGTGKTFTMGGIAVESRRYGIAKKPVILAHNANSSSVAHEIQMMYPAAKVLYVDNLSGDTIAVRMRQIANDDWDAIVLPHSLIDRLSFREETLMGMAQEDIRSLEEEAYAAAEDDGVTLDAKMLNDEEELKKLRSVTAKELVKARNRIIETIKKQAQRSSREGAIPFEDLGIDMVLVDEVHEFKKPPISTRMNMKGLNTQTSDRSIALQFITRYIRANNFGGNVHTFTGTPITNTLSEIFHQMRYVMEDEMREAGVETWDGWFGSFAKEVQDVELSAAGEYEAINRLAGFINVPELRRMIGQYMDVVFADDMPEMQPRKVNGKTLADPDLTEMERAELLNGRTEGAANRPYKKVVNVSSDLTPKQTEIFAQLQAYARSWRNMGGKARMEAMRNGSPESPIITEGMANKASFDVRLTEDERWAGQEGFAPDDPGSKASRVVNNVLEVYNSDPRAGQVIFSDMGYSTSQKRSIGRNANGEKLYRTVKTFSTIRDIVERLVQGGIPREQIAIVDGSTSKEKRREIADAMNDLRIRVVIGSTDTLGVGVNMQRNLRAMHHLDAPYMPGELEQRNGRGLRQGNQWNTVLEYRYMTDRLDGRRWQILAIKQRFINAFMKSQSDSRVIEGDAASDEESDILQSFSEAAGDPRILIRAKLRKNVEALQRAERMHSNGVADARQTLRGTREAIEWNRGALKQLQANNLPQRLQDMMAAQSEDFQMVVRGTLYDRRADAEGAVTLFLSSEMRMEQTGVEVGTYRDLPVTARWPSMVSRPDLVIEVDGQEFASNSLRGLEQQIRNYPLRIEKVEANIAQREASLARLEEVSRAPFARADDLAAAQKRLKALEQDIEINPVPPPAWLRAGAPVDSAAFRAGREFVVTGHRWTKEGWYVLGQDAKGEMAIPYTEVMDAQGMPVYEEREFQSPEVIDKVGDAAPDVSPAQDGGASFSRSRSTFSRGAQKQANVHVQRLVDAITENWETKPKIIVAFDMNDPAIPEAVRLEDVRQRSGGAGGAPEGFYYRGDVYLMSSKLNTSADVARVLFHEALGHYGLRSVFGKDLKAILQQVALFRKAEVDAKIKEYGLRGVNVKDRLLAAEEVLAEMAQSRPQIGFVQRAIAAIRTWLRSNVPMFSGLRLTDAEIIRSYILPARRLVERGGPGGGGPRGGISFSRAAAENSLPRAMFSRSAMAGLAKSATAQIALTANTPGKLSWWHKTLGTQYNLAQRSPAFKKVYDAAQGFIDDVSYFANEAANLAPTILPKLESWADIKKRPVSAADNKAVAAPIFEGTLEWRRDESGKPARVDDLAAAAEALTAEQKAQRLLRTGEISEGVLRMWRGLPVEQFENLVKSAYETRMLKAGIVWTPDELKSMFKLTGTLQKDGRYDGQIGLYHEFRAATDKSIDSLAKTDMLRLGGEDVQALRDLVLDAADAGEAARLLADYLGGLAMQQPGRATQLMQTAESIFDRARQSEKLQQGGYAPLSRFGRYSVDVVGTDGKREYFGLYETAREANVAAAQFKAAFPGSIITQGTMSQEAFKLFDGVTPESLEMFGNMLSLDSTGENPRDQAFQEYLRLTKNNRSALKRLIHRKGIEGYSSDVGRVLASFIYSNSRRAAGGVHLGEMNKAINAIPKEQGQLKDAAMGLAEYVQNPREEAQALRGLLFAQYLGGSIASAMVNMTQPLAVSLPYLSQFGGASRAGAELLRAIKGMATSEKYPADLAKALKDAEEDGTVSPQEVHHLMAQAQGAGSLRSGDGTRVGDARAKTSNALSILSLAWGKVFGAAEQVNRRSTFIAAYRIAQQAKMADPAEFARQAVVETQFVYSKANKNVWGRGAIGGTLMTFKTYGIAYLELMQRMYQSGPEGKRAVLLAMAIMFLLGGAGGLPFAEDLEDVADGIGQAMGYNFSSKKVRQEVLEDLFGQAAADFIDKGLTGLPGSLVDVSGRLGMGNMLPGTGLFLQRSSHTNDLKEIAGPAGDLIQRAFNAAGQALTGDLSGAALTIAPRAAANAVKGLDMMARGMYRDDKGYKVIDTTAAEGAAKVIGFQPASVAKIQEANYLHQRAKDLYNAKAKEIRSEWARGLFEGNPDLVAEARAELADWNEKNPDQRIAINMPSIMKRVREMAKSKDQRIADTAPKAMRAQMRAENAQIRESL